MSAQRTARERGAILARRTLRILGLRTPSPTVNHSFGNRIGTVRATRYHSGSEASHGRSRRDDGGRAGGRADTGDHPPAAGVEPRRGVLEICRRAPCDELLDYLAPGTWWGLGRTLHFLGRDVEAEAALRQALELRRAQGHVEDRLTANVLISLGDLRKERGELDEALAWYEQALAFTGSLQRAGALKRVGEIRMYRGDLAGARERIEAVLSQARSVFGDQSAEAGLGRWVLGEILQAAGDAAGAEPPGREPPRTGPRHRRTAAPGRRPGRPGRESGRRRPPDAAGHRAPRASRPVKR
jgi:tetratricopeptide (TPR) repeat protein